MTLAPNHSPLSNTQFDVVIVGAGVVGCAVARKFAIEGAKVLIAEKAVDILDGASKANSAILHTGFDSPPPGTQEHQCIAEGYQEYLDIRSKFNLPLLECGAIILAWNREQEAKLEGICSHAHHNGVTSAKLISRKEIRALEPELSAEALAAVYIPEESVIDPWSTPHAYLMQAIQHGANLLRQCELHNGEFEGSQWVLQTSKGKLHTRHVINCAGLYGDRVDEALIGQSQFSIKPRKGQFVVFDKSARQLTQSILLPVPTEFTKGVVVCPTIFGNLLVGPTAEEQLSRTDSSVDSDALTALIKQGEFILPNLNAHSVTATYAGIRPATQFKDYQIKWDHSQNYCCVGGIRSTGLSAALGIARFVFEEYENRGYSHQAPVQLKWPQITAIADPGPRDWQHKENEGIVCHCEMVTRREIKQALTGPLAANSLAGLKRKTRVTMGRCQGFYCSAKLSELTAGLLISSIGLDKK